jgi:multiple sugar transport system substrate-binding protein
MNRAFRLGAIAMVFAVLLVGIPMAAMAAPVNITVWDQVPDNPTGIQLFTLQLQKEFDQKFPNIKVTHLPFPAVPDPSQWIVAITADYASGNGANIYAGGVNSSIGVGMGVKGMAVDLAPYVNAWADWKTVYDSVKKDVSQAGTSHVYSIPNGVDVVLLVYRTDFAKAAGLDPSKGPATWEELRAWAKKLADPKKNIAGFSVLADTTADWWFEYFVWQAGGDLTTVNDKGQITLHFTDQPVIDAINYYRAFAYTDQSSQKNVLETLGDVFTDYWQDRTAISIFYPSWIGWWVPSGFKMENNNLAVLPKGKTSATAFSMQTWAMSTRGTKAQQDAAWQYTMYMQGKDANTRTLQYANDNKALYLNVPIFSDIDFSKYLKIIPQQWVQPIIDSVKVARPEYAGKGPLSPYVAAMISQAMASPKANVKAILQAAQDQAYAEYLDKYNQDVLNQK